MIADSADNVPCGGAPEGGREGLPLSSFRWKCDSKFDVDSAVDSTRSGLNTVTALLAIPYSSSVAGENARVQELSTESSGFSCRGIGQIAKANKLYCVLTHEDRRWGQGADRVAPFAKWTHHAIIVGGDEQSTCMKSG